MTATTGAKPVDGGSAGLYRLQQDNVALIEVVKAYMDGCDNDECELCKNARLALNRKPAK